MAPRTLKLIRRRQITMPDGQRPAISVVVPTCNGSRHIEAAIRSLLVQTEAADELIVCDDRSDDDTLDRVRAVAGDRVRVVCNSSRLGLGGNWNRCIELAGSPWVAVFHQDDVMEPEHLAEHRAAIRERADAGLVVSAVHLIDHRGDPLPREVVSATPLCDDNHVFEPGSLLPALAVSNPIFCSGVTLSKPAHANVGGFQTDLRYVLDWAFWARLNRAWPVAWRRRPTVAVRWHTASETHQFRAGLVDLEEQETLTSEILASLPELDPNPLGELRTARNARLARAYLNRAYTAAVDGHRRLSRASLRRALELDRMGTIVHLASTPRLVIRLILGRASGRPRHGSE